MGLDISTALNRINGKTVHYRDFCLAYWRISRGPSYKQFRDMQYHYDSDDDSRIYCQMKNLLCDSISEKRLSNEINYLKYEI